MARPCDRAPSGVPTPITLSVEEWTIDIITDSVVVENLQLLLDHMGAVWLGGNGKNGFFNLNFTPNCPRWTKFGTHVGLH